jgi:uncharacterized protein
MIQLPYSLVGFNLILGSTQFAGRCEEVILPKLEYKTEEILNAGMAMAIKMPTTLMPMDATFKMSESTYEGFLLAGSPLAGFVDAIVFGHLQNAEGKTSEMIYTMRGTILKVDSGSAKTGDIKAGMQTIEMNLMSIAVTRDEVPLFSVDAQRGFVLHGVIDQTAAQRKNLKLS